LSYIVIIALTPIATSPTSHLPQHITSTEEKKGPKKLTVIRLTNVGILPLPAAAAVVEEESDRVALLLRDNSRCVLRI
jgi:hypothetical protein